MCEYNCLNDKAQGAFVVLGVLIMKCLQNFISSSHSWRYYLLLAQFLISGARFLKCRCIILYSFMSIGFLHYNEMAYWFNEFLVPMNYSACSKSLCFQ